MPEHFFFHPVPSQNLLPWTDGLDSVAPESFITLAETFPLITPLSSIYSHSFTTMFPLLLSP